MNQRHDLGAMAKDIIDSNPYMTLGTADGSGCLWASPVYDAPDGYSQFYWVSSPEATHSRNIAARAEVTSPRHESGPASLRQECHCNQCTYERERHHGAPAATTQRCLRQLLLRRYKCESVARTGWCAASPHVSFTRVVHQFMRTTANNRESTYGRIGCFAGISEQL